MSDKAFLDTNILVYAHDAGSGRKHSLARKLLERLWTDRTGVLSTQVLQEFWVNVRRKARRPIPLDEARELVESYLAWEVVPTTGQSVLEAITLEDRFQLPFWDALILQTAIQAGVAHLYSEVFNSGQLYGSVKVVNPFL